MYLNKFGEKYKKEHRKKGKVFKKNKYRNLDRVKHNIQHIQLTVYYLKRACACKRSHVVSQNKKFERNN